MRHSRDVDDGAARRGKRRSGCGRSGGRAPRDDDQRDRILSNNILDGTIAARNGATGSISGNYTSATAVLNTIAAPPAAAGSDWDGQPRPAGSTDIGADELAASGPVPTAPPNLRIIQP